VVGCVCVVRCSAVVCVKGVREGRCGGQRGSEYGARYKIFTG
jgi:hypothetical protein